MERNLSKQTKLSTSNCSVKAVLYAAMRNGTFAEFWNKNKEYLQTSNSNCPEVTHTKSFGGK